MERRPLYIAASVFILMAIGAGIYFYVSSRGSAPSDQTASDASGDNGFTPFGRILPKNSATTTNSAASDTDSGTQSRAVTAAIRLLSSTPVGGYAASTTASTTIVRWVDRGRGNVYETRENDSAITTLSNTLVPQIYASSWNKNLTAFIATTIQSDESTVSAIFAELVARPIPKQASSTSATSTAVTAQNGAGSQTKYDLKGLNLPTGVIGYAVSPKKDKLFMLINENGRGVGYISTFEGKSVAQIFDTPVTMLNVEWPEDNTIALTTKGSSSDLGYLYFVNPKTGAWKKVLGPIPGLSTKVSRDAKYVLASSATDSGLSTNIYSVAKGTVIDAVIRTLADKCAWGNNFTNMVYCGVPSLPVKAAYPEDWYMGTMTSSDKIWQVNATTGEVHLVSSIVDQAHRIVDAFNLSTDPKDEYLFFMNKNDLSLWSLDLIMNN